MNKLKNNTVNQQELSEILEVDRVTINAWQNKGMPFTSNGKGNLNSYNIGTAIHWRAGKDGFNNLVKWNKVDRREITPIRCFILGRLFSLFDDVCRSEIKHIIDSCQRAGFEKSETLLALGYCIALIRHFKSAPVIDASLLN